MATRQYNQLDVVFNDLCVKAGIDTMNLAKRTISLSEEVNPEWTPILLIAITRAALMSLAAATSGAQTQNKLLKEKDENVLKSNILFGALLTAFSSKAVTQGDDAHKTIRQAMIDAKKWTKLIYDTNLDLNPAFDKK